MPDRNVIVCDCNGCGQNITSKTLPTPAIVNTVRWNTKFCNRLSYNRSHNFFLRMGFCEIGTTLEVMASPLFRILIADDSALVRDGLKQLISNASPGWVVCGEAVDGEEALLKVDECGPEILLLDLFMPILNGVQVVEILRKSRPSLSIILLSEQDASTMRRLANDLKVYGMPKSRISTDLVPLLQRLADMRHV